MNALKLGVDFKKVKKEVICADEDPKSVSSSSSLGRKRGRKRENSEEEEKIDADDSFEVYCVHTIYSKFGSSFSSMSRNLHEHE